MAKIEYDEYGRVLPPVKEKEVVIQPVGGDCRNAIQLGSVMMLTPLVSDPLFVKCVEILNALPLWLRVPEVLVGEFGLRGDRVEIGVDSIRFLFICLHNGQFLQFALKMVDIGEDLFMSLLEFGRKNGGVWGKVDCVIHYISEEPVSSSVKTLLDRARGGDKEASAWILEKWTGMVGKEGNVETSNRDRVRGKRGDEMDDSEIAKDLVDKLMHMFDVEDSGGKTDVSNVETIQ